MAADLSKITLFQGLQEADLRELTSRAQVRAVPAETTIIREGERADSLFLILKGKVKVYLQDPAGKKLVVDVRYAGQYVGEMVLDDKPRSASVRTVERSELAVVSRDDFKALQVIRNLIRLTRGQNVKTVQDVRSRAELQLYIEQLNTTKAEDLPSVRRWTRAKRWALVTLLVFAVGQYYFLDVLLEVISLPSSITTLSGR
jgi:CRP-like cAMP-binding protein